MTSTRSSTNTSMFCVGIGFVAHSPEKKRVNFLTHLMFLSFAWLVIWLFEGSSLKIMNTWWLIEVDKSIDPDELVQKRSLNEGRGVVPGSSIKWGL